MSFQLLPETDSLLEVLLRPSFAGSYTTMGVVLIGISYYLEKLRMEDASAPALLVHQTTYFDVLSYSLLLGISTYTNSYQITRSVAIGRSPPIALKRLQSLPWPMNIICGSYGDRKIYTFAFQMLCFPGLVVVMALYFLSVLVNGPERALEWRMPLQKYLPSALAWRLLVGSAVFTLNYIAAHNPTQSVLVPSEDSDKPETTSTTSTAESKKSQ